MPQSGRRQAAAADAARTIAQQCLAIRARRLQRGLTRIYDRALRPHGLSVAQLGVLVAVTLAGDVQPKRLCEILDLEKSTLSRNVARMVTNGWIEMQRSGRSQRLRLTPDGLATLARARPAWQRAQRQARRLLSREMIDVLRHAGERS